MQRAIVSAVQGSRICANGRWLTAIGNKAVHPGDVVWTDGRCVYGNFAEGGGAAPIVNSSEPYVPLLMSDGTRAVYHKGKITKHEKGARHQLMASRGNSFAFADGKVLDVYLDEQGNQYALQWGEYSFTDHGEGDTYENLEGQPGIVRNGHMEHPLDLSEYSHYCYDYAYEEAAAIETPLSGIGEILRIYWNYCTLANGWYESADSYCYLLECYAHGCHMNGINWLEDSEADIGYLVEFSSYMWVMVTPEGSQPLWAMTVRDLNIDFVSEHYRYRIYADEFTLPLPDGYYIEGTKVVPKVNKTRDEWMYPFSGKLYSPKKKLIYESDFYISQHYSLGDIKKGQWLMSAGDYLYSLKGGKKKFLSYDVHNSRLHAMKNRARWTKGEEPDGTY
ncbi:MAG: hypothetical protein J6N51_08775 [Selenomonas sp.]|nr:hypothetical protein [Selenomonas sp.]